MTTIRLAEELANRIKPVMHLLGRGTSVNSFAEDAVDQMLKLIETPDGHRKLPRLVQLIDTARGPEADFNSGDAAALQLSGETAELAAHDEPTTEVQPPPVLKFPPHESSAAELNDQTGKDKAAGS